MSKLQRVIDSQTIQFMAIPKVFGNLAADLPSGAVKLSNGENAYWRLHRNLAELKKNRKNQKQLIEKLVAAFKSLVASDAFLNHYGVASVPEVGTDLQLSMVFRSLLQLNTKRVDYSTISHDRNKPLVESITIPLGNLVFFNAYRGVQEQPKASGIKGRLWLNESTDDAFVFTVVSPVVNLAESISPDRLISEVLNRLKANLPIMAHKPKIEFDDLSLFAGYLDRGLQALETKHAAQQNGAGKKAHKAAQQQALTAAAPKAALPRSGGANFVDEPASTATINAVPASAEDGSDLEGKFLWQTPLGSKIADGCITQMSSLEEQAMLEDRVFASVLTPAEFVALSVEDQTDYIQFFGELGTAVSQAELADLHPLARSILAFIRSGILAPQWQETRANGGLDTHEYFLARVIDVSKSAFGQLVKEDEIVGDTTGQALEPVVVDTKGIATQEQTAVGVNVIGGDYTFTEGKSTDDLSQVSNQVLHLVKDGDTLFGIAELVYGDGDLWPTIHLANKDKILDPNLIYPGQILEIPKIDRPVEVKALGAETVTDGVVSQDFSTAKTGDDGVFDESGLLAEGGIGNDAPQQAAQVELESSAPARGETTSMVHVDEAPVVTAALTHNAVTDTDPQVSIESAANTTYTSSDSDPATAD